jgi:predicted lipid carrier protein YhbT
MSVQFHPAEKGGDCYLAIAAGKIATGRGRHPKPSVTVSGAERDLIEIAEGRKDITYLLSQGKARIAGDYYHGIDLSRIALAIRQTLVAK